jgi:hypothetical protein
MKLIGFAKLFVNYLMQDADKRNGNGNGGGGGGGDGGVYQPSWRHSPRFLFCTLNPLPHKGGKRGGQDHQASYGQQCCWKETAAVDLRCFLGSDTEVGGMCCLVEECIS